LLLDEWANDSNSGVFLLQSSAKKPQPSGIHQSEVHDLPSVLALYERNLGNRPENALRTSCHRAASIFWRELTSLSTVSPAPCKASHRAFSIAATLLRSGLWSAIVVPSGRIGP